MYFNSGSGKGCVISSLVAYHSNMSVHGEDSLVGVTLMKFGGDKFLNSKHHAILPSDGYRSAKKRCTHNDIIQYTVILLYMHGFHLCIYCMEGYCVHGTSVPAHCSMNNKQWFKGQVYSKLHCACAVHNLDLVI